LVSLSLQNLRSYSDGTVEFGDGVNLFEGDVGSGKSTILLAIEFALFGLAEVASRSLLRHGEKEGGVELVFQVKDRTVKATRRLRRTATGATVKGCVIDVDGKTTKLSSNEMRQRVLEILEYGERRNPRARLDIFTYGTYTPQEDMRTVLATDAKMHTQRKDTLRRALDLEEYSQAAQNLDAIRLQIDRDANVLEGMTMGIDQVRVEMERAVVELENERTKAEKARTDLEASIGRTIETAKGLKGLRKGEDRYQEAFARSKEADARLAAAQGDLKEVAAKIEALRGAAKELDEVRKKLGEHSNALKELDDLEEMQGAVEKLRTDLRAATADLERARVELEGAGKALHKVEELAAKLEGLEDPAEPIRKARDALEDLTRERTRLDHEVERLELEIRGIDAEVEELTSLEGVATCPKCQQPLTEEHLADLLEDNRKRRRDLSSRIREAASRSNRLSEDIDAKGVEIEGMDAVVEDRRRKHQDLERAREEASRIEDLARRVDEHPAVPIERELKAMEANLDIERLRELQQLSGAVRELKGSEKRLADSIEEVHSQEQRHATAQTAFDAATKEAARALKDLGKASEEWDPEALAQARTAHDEALSKEGSLRTTVTHLEDLVKRLEGDVSGLAEKVEGLEGLQERRALHVHVSAWLSDRVVPSVRAMERSVMALMADEMDRSASRWFGQLVEDPDLVLSIDEDFVPLVTHQDYEMDLDALSGGERTAAAFSYRLALNGLVRRNAIPDQRNLLILDEPTDGFSREQLARMGAVFEELDADQVVIVSHDRELRAFADRVYLVKKTGGSSSVTHVA
jgi:exonuclease SbcC